MVNIRDESHIHFLMKSVNKIDEEYINFLMNSVNIRNEKGMNRVNIKLERCIHFLMNSVEETKIHSFIIMVYYKQGMQRTKVPLVHS